MNYEVVFSVEPPDEILGMTQYGGKIIIATTRGVYEIGGDEMEYAAVGPYSVSRVPEDETRG